MDNTIGIRITGPFIYRYGGFDQYGMIEFIRDYVCYGGIALRITVDSWNRWLDRELEKVYNWDHWHEYRKRIANGEALLEEESKELELLSSLVKRLDLAALAHQEKCINELCQKMGLTP